MTAPHFPSQLARRKRRAILEPLFKAARLTNDLALLRMNRRFPDRLEIRAAHTTLLPHIDLEGTRITTLAERLGVTKQAVAPLVEELEEMGFVTKIRDPEDGRAKLVQFTRRGRRGLLEGLDLLQEIEAELAHKIGRKKIALLGETLRAIIDVVERDLEE